MSAELERRLHAVEAQLAIQQLASRYALAVDSRDIVAVGELFSSGTRFGEHGTGPAGARAFYETVLRQFYRSFHQVVGHVITDVTQTSARGTVYCRAEHERGDAWVTVLMTYGDRYVLEQGEWCFLARRPRTLCAANVGDVPRAVSFASWPGRDGRPPNELPHADPSWDAFWDRFADDRAAVTTLP